MQARLTAHVPDAAAVVRWLARGEAATIGRADSNALAIAHPSVSRAHARIEPDGDGWTLVDLGSKNGSHVDGARIERAPLSRTCWLRFGDVHCEFVPLADTDASAGVAALESRRRAATAHTLRLDGVQRLDDLLDASLRGVLDLAQCDRGFVLLEGSDGLHVRASLDLDADAFGGQAFSGSVGAVRRALAQRRSVVANDIGAEAWLASRQSVVGAGLSALVCVPLVDGPDTLGAVYADRTHAGPPITTLDLELLEAFAERAALWIAARRTTELLEAVDAAPNWDGIVARHAGAPA